MGAQDLQKFVWFLDVFKNLERSNRVIGILACVGRARIAALNVHIQQPPPLSGDRRRVDAANVPAKCATREVEAKSKPASDFQISSR